MIKLAPTLILVALTATVAACGPTEPCTPESTRCRGNVAEICGSDGRYRELADCDQVSAQSGIAFTCGHVDEETPDGPVEGFTCLPATEVDGDGAGGVGGSDAQQ